MVKRARASNKQKRFKRDAKQKDYAIMATLASEVVMHNRGRGQYRTGNPEYVLFEFPHWVTFDKTFPKGYIVEKTVETNTYKINAVKLLDWLYNNGYSAYNTKMLVAQTRVFELLVKSVDQLFNEGE